MDKSLKENLGSADVWKRGAYILLFAVCYGVSKVVFWAVVIFQFLALLITRGYNEQLASFSLSLSAYIYQLISFMMGTTEHRPYPFADWPSASELGSAQTPAAARKKASKKKVARKKAATAKPDEDKPAEDKPAEPGEPG